MASSQRLVVCFSGTLWAFLAMTLPCVCYTGINSAFEYLSPSGRTLIISIYMQTWDLHKLGEEDNLRSSLSKRTQNSLELSEGLCVYLLGMS